MDYATFEESTFPVVTVTFTGVKSTDENFRAYLNRIRTIYDQQTPFLLIFDATNASLPGLRHQMMQANWLKENNDLITQYCLGTVYIISNGLVRGILRSIFALQKQPCPYTIVESRQDAADFINTKLLNLNHFS
ncbi:MAG: STAS/SEC14 domain-containing protein [Bacteroidota bacterium]